MYIIKISNKAFVKMNKADVVIVNDYTKATHYEYFGDAMKIAAQINVDWEQPIAKVISYEKPQE